MSYPLTLLLFLSSAPSDSKIIDPAQKILLRDIGEHFQTHLCGRIRLGEYKTYVLNFNRVNACSCDISPPDFSELDWRSRNIWNDSGSILRYDHGYDSSISNHDRHVFPSHAHWVARRGANPHPSSIVDYVDVEEYGTDEIPRWCRAAKDSHQLMVPATQRGYSDRPRV